MPSKKNLLVVGILTVIAALLYANSFQVPWQFDDRPNIVDNPSVHLHTFSPDRLLRLLTNSYSESIRFFSYFTFSLNFYFGKLNVFGYHLINLLIHIATGILIFWFILLTLNLPSQKERYDSIGFKVAFLASLIFIAHPVQTQSVTYIVQRMTSLTAMFYVLSMIFFIKGRLAYGTRQIFFYAGMCLSGALSIFSKETGFMLPIFIVLHEVLFFGKGKEKVLTPPLVNPVKNSSRPLSSVRLRKSGVPPSSERQSTILNGVKILLLLAGLGLAGFLFLGGKYIHIIQEGYQYRDFTMSERVMTQFRVVLHYLTLLIFPHPSRLNLDYDFGISSSLLHPPATLLSLLLILSFIGIGIWKAKKWPILSFFIFWYFGNLVIESSIIPLEMVYEHRLYLPSIGPIFLFSLLLVRLWEKWMPAKKSKREVIFAGLTFVILIPLSWATIERNSIWRSEFELWRDCVRKSPNKGRPHYNLGYYYSNNGQTEKAMEEFELAVKLDPKMAPAHLNMGVIYYNKGLFKEAALHFEKALTIYPKYTQAYIHLGEVYNRIGKGEEGLAQFERALSIDPGNARILQQRGLTYLQKGDLGKALEAFQKAALIEPNQIESHVNLGEVYLRMGMIDQALLEIRKALSLNPDNGDANTFLGMISLQKGRMKEAISSFQQALKANPEDVTALSNLGIAYRYRGMMDEAMSQFEKVLSIKPNDEEARINLGEAFLAKGMVSEAIRENENVLQLNPRSVMARVILGEIYFKQGRLDQAIIEWKRALEINPKEAKAHHNLAAAYYGNKEFRLAIKHFDEASALGFKVHPQLADWLKPYR